MKIKKIVFIFYLAALVFQACTKENKSCFDQELYNLHHNDGCTTDCPGVRGCDGKIYCNECEARRNGIHVQ